MEVDIKNIFSKNLITVSDRAALSEAEALMAKHNIRHLPVANEAQKIVGVLSRTDITALRRVEAPFNTMKVYNFMSAPARAVEKKNSVKELAKMFITKKISSALVTENNAIVGIITTEDLLKLLVQNIEVLGAKDYSGLADQAPEGMIF